MVYKIEIKKSPRLNYEFLRKEINEEISPLMRYIEKKDPCGEYKIALNDNGSFLHASIHIKKNQPKGLSDLFRFLAHRVPKNLIALLVVDWDALTAMGPCRDSIIQHSYKCDLLPQRKLEELTKGFYKWF